MATELDAGLDAVDVLPVGSAFAQLTAGARAEGGASGWFVRAEIDARPVDWLSAFAYAQLDDAGESVGAGLRARL